MGFCCEEYGGAWPEYFEFTSLEEQVKNLVAASTVKGSKFGERLCPGCGAAGMAVFYEVERVPVHSVLLMPTREAALNYTKGEVRLGFCHTCGFISNVAFDPDLHEYSPRYEETQEFSPTFNAFHQRLAARLIERYDLHAKSIIEIGCGKGEFLTLLCELGGNRGIGFDPAYVEGRSRSVASDRVTFIRDFYSEKYTTCHADFICCKMTLEHVWDTSDFVSTVRRSIGNRLNTVVFFQVPDVSRILMEIAFWDVYYEHCSYFSAGSLARLFRKCGFEVVSLLKDYEDQYLMIEARPSKGKNTVVPPQENDMEALTREVAYFSRNCRQKIDTWKGYIEEIKQSGWKAVIWGSGSKGVAFLTTLNIEEEIEYAVDINPYKHGTYMAGTGQEIVGPEFLQEYQPDVVIVMNPIYREEIERDMQGMNLTPELITV